MVPVNEDKASRKCELSIRHGSLPVIMITARTEPSLEEKAMSSGARAFFASPLLGDQGPLGSLFGGPQLE